MSRLIPQRSFYSSSTYWCVSTVRRSVTNTLNTPSPFSITESLQIDAGTMNDSTVSEERSGGMLCGNEREGRGEGWMDAGADEIEW